MWSLILKAIMFLMPPISNANGGHDQAYKAQVYEFRTRRWRWVVFGWLVTIGTILGASIVLAFGTPESMGDYKGLLVKRSEFSEIQRKTDERIAEQKAKLDKIEEIDIRLLVKDLVDAKIGQCKSRDKRYYTERLDQLKDLFFNKTKRVWEERTCAELGAS